MQATTSLASLILLALLGDKSARAYFIIPVTCIAKLYSNTLLAILNSRMHIADGRNDPGFGEAQVDRLSGRGKLGWPNRNRLGFGASRGPPLVGCITVHTEVWTDDGEAGQVEVSLTTSSIRWYGRH